MRRFWRWWIGPDLRADVRELQRAITELAESVRRLRAAVGLS